MKYVILVFLLLPFVAGIAGGQRPDDCSWESTSKSRKTVKLRAANDGASYTNFNSGRPVTLDRWFEMTCKLDALVPEKLPDDSPIAGAETLHVTLRGYLQGFSPRDWRIVWQLLGNQCIKFARHLEPPVQCDRPTGIEIRV